jgi:sugar (pentulose or hexulose) kinase
VAIYLGIDAGTTSMKAALFDPNGHLLAVDRHEYIPDTPQPAWVELAPETYWQACCRVVRNVIAKSQVNPAEIRALAISSQGETFIPVDDSGNPTRNAIVWLDNRAVDESNQIANHFGLDTVYHVTGQPEVVPTWPACKILWLRHHEPDVFKRSARYLLLEDFLLFHLTGQYVTERAQQTSSIMLDLHTGNWWREMLDFVGVSPEHFGHLMDPGELVCAITSSAAEATGLTTHTMAVTGSMDQAMGAVGSGNIKADIVSETTGGALAIVVSLDKPTFDPLRRVPCYFHAIPKEYCLLPYGQTAGMALKWFRDQFYQLETRMALDAGQDSYDWMTALAAQAPAGSDGLVVLPHLEGAFCPEFNLAAKAVFFGATMRHTRAHFIRGIMESVAYMLKRNLVAVGEMGVTVDEIRCMGGAARSPLWLQIKADVLQKPVRAVEQEEAALLGAAILASVATGEYPSISAAVSHMVRLKPAIQPNIMNKEVYQHGYDQYVELYDRLAPMFK